jgi:hypothetical protein
VLGRRVHEKDASGDEENRSMGAPFAEAHSNTHIGTFTFYADLPWLNQSFNKLAIMHHFFQAQHEAASPLIVFR